MNREEYIFTFPADSLIWHCEAQGKHTHCVDSKVFILFYSFHLCSLAPSILVRSNVIWFTMNTQRPIKTKTQLLLSFGHVSLLKLMVFWRHTARAFISFPFSLSHIGTPRQQKISTSGLEVFLVSSLHRGSFSHLLTSIHSHTHHDPPPPPTIHHSQHLHISFLPKRWGCLHWYQCESLVLYATAITSTSISPGEDYVWILILETCSC